ncbi:hypothetical protein [Hansschlegelia sp.]|uniref:hypothetical protein n=1 Tax=Hansschlegelia sp. TaxID=2041892 RepID=UPI002C3E7DC4|nr:hypothetical protein [Hansschlegelia sp.]HVI27511.1 hypothetical protein [Hansschlegelia sp.]
MTERSVFAVDRGVFTDPDFADEPFTEREAWLWLISDASFKAGRRRGSSGVVELNRGEFSHSVRFMAEAWKWSKSRVDRFLDRLEKRDMIRDTSRDSQKVYLIKNYNRFQVVAAPKRDSEGDALRDDSGTPAGQTRNWETGKEDTKADALDAGASTSPGLFAEEPAYANDRDRLWGEGKTALAAWGVQPKPAGQMIGKWLRDSGDDPPKVLAAIRRAEQQRTEDPIPFVTRILQADRSRPNGGSPREDRRSTSAIERRLTDLDAGRFG